MAMYVIRSGQYMPRMIEGEPPFNGLMFCAIFRQEMNACWSLYIAGDITVSQFHDLLRLIKIPVGKESWLWREPGRV